MNNINYPAPKQEYKVLVRCFTFNHSNYIEDALNGFAMQQTNFPFVCVVVDDASTDGEQEVIKGWMERECDMSNAETIDIPTSVVIIVPHKTNVSCTFAFYLLKQNLYRVKEEKKKHVNPWREKCKYEALCEGDDYWIDSLKLQKQVDFMEENPNHSLCFHAYSKLFNDGNLLEVHQFSQDVIDVPKENMILGGGGYMATNSMLYVRKYYDNIPEWIKKAPVGDLPLMLLMLEMGKVAYINDNMSVYRILTSGSWSSRMSNSYKKRFRHYRAIIKMWNGFDKWSGYKYHSIIKKKKYSIRKSFFYVTLKFLLKIFPFR